MHQRLIITNGQSAVDAIVAAGVKGDFLAWNDVLHDGPVPSGLDLITLSSERARFISSLGWGSLNEVERDFEVRDAILRTARDRQEVICWFEHDLYDQLQLWQVLAWLSDANVRVGLICHDRFIGYQNPDELLEASKSAVEIGPEESAKATRLWEAFRSNEPYELWDLRHSDFLFARDAIHRWAQTYPAPGTGLNRSERFTLEFLSGQAGGTASFSELFSALSKQEEAQYMGDASYMILLQRLSKLRHPLITMSRGASARFPTVTVTEKAKSRLQENPWAWDPYCDRWIGGVELNKEYQWCFSRTENRFVNRAETLPALSQGT